MFSWKLRKGYDPQGAKKLGRVGSITGIFEPKFTNLGHIFAKVAVTREPYCQ